MEQLNQLIDKIKCRINVNLIEHDINIETFINSTTNVDTLVSCYASYEAEPLMPLKLHVALSNIAGSYLLGKCRITESVVCECDIRGNKLKRKGAEVEYYDQFKLPEDEVISITDAFLYKVLVHSESNNPETPEEFFIRNSVAAHYAIINGSTLEGCFLGAFSTIDQTPLHSCVVGEFSYINTDEQYHQNIPSGTLLIENDSFSFNYTFPAEPLKHYIFQDQNHQPSGLLVDFMKSVEFRLNQFPDRLYGNPISRQQKATINRFAVINEDSNVDKNVTICQRVLIESSTIGSESVLTENSCIISSRLCGFNAISHGSRILHSELGLYVFTGINCFLNGKENAAITIGERAIILPHTIIDSPTAIEIPGNTVIWGLINNQSDVEKQSISIKHFNSLSEKSIEGVANNSIPFKGDGASFIRYLHLLTDEILSEQAEDTREPSKARLQTYSNTTVHVLQPCRTGPDTGLYPTFHISHAD